MSRRRIIDPLCPTRRRESNLHWYALPHDPQILQLSQHVLELLVRFDEDTPVNHAVDVPWMLGEGDLIHELAGTGFLHGIRVTEYLAGHVPAAGMAAMQEFCDVVDNGAEGRHALGVDPADDAGIFLEVSV
ncbi:hypothetical protein BC938DRAFT_480400 [Jimgerdemannia flammicorona]|uniref:Uncharacterized protein n=1 Tax=Jimgerdemannia flammicorona TaxID=994334 RepID=A0A433QIJ8_9FUNG|nr:hypothetical protein BC938DRAFT_480400 [Jimgerdemannia flammicorona]